LKTVIFYSFTVSGAPRRRAGRGEISATLLAEEIRHNPRNRKLVNSIQKRPLFVTMSIQLQA
jgi:hypothetical protein